jgi:hypothetical protein
MVRMREKSMRFAAPKQAEPMMTQPVQNFMCLRFCYFLSHPDILSGFMPAELLMT